MLPGKYKGDLAPFVEPVIHGQSQIMFAGP